MPTLIPWPSDNIELAGTNVSIKYPGRVVVKSQHSNKELFYDTSTGEFEGTITLAEQTRKSAEHYEVLAFLAEMQSNPGEYYTLLPWEKPSIYTIGSTLGQLSTQLVYNVNVASIADVYSISGGVWRIRPRTIESGDNYVITAGEHFGFGSRTYRVATSRKLPGPNQEHEITTSPIIPINEVPTQNFPHLIFKRVSLPCRFVAGQDISETERGDGGAGPWSIRVVEQAI